MSGVPLSEVAVRVSREDNCAVVKFGVEAGCEIVVDDDRVTLAADIGPGHRFAIQAIPAGEHVVQYGQPIGTSRGLGPGDAITPETMSDDIPIVRDLPDDETIRRACDMVGLEQHGTPARRARACLDALGVD